MKILTIINSLGTGGAEKLVADMLPYFKEQGHSVDLLLLVKDTNSLFSAQIEEVGINIIYSPHPIYSFKNILFIRRILKQYDIAHVHLFPAQYWSALSFSSTPTIVTEHCTTNKRRKNKLFWPIERLTYGRYDRIVTISDKALISLKKWLRIHSDRYEIIYNGIKLDKFANAVPAILDEFSPNSKKIVMVGRFNPTKDQPTAIKAMALLPDHYHLLLIGDGKLRVECENLANQLGVSGKVHFMGKRANIPELLKACDLNLISSHSEGLSISSLEALSSGRPLITSDVNGLREINSGVGLLFEDSNHKELAEKIELILTDKNLYEDIVAKSLKKVSNYDIKHTVTKHLKLYQDVLNQKS